MAMTENCFDSTGHTVPYTKKLYNRAHCLIDMMEQPKIQLQVFDSKHYRILPCLNS